MDLQRPDPGEAPGLKKRPRANGTIAYYWVATSADPNPLAKAYQIKTCRLHGDEYEIAHLCRRHTKELQLWLSENGGARPDAFDGSLKSLIQQYRRTPESSYHRLKHSTRVMYDESLDLLERSFTVKNIGKLTGLDFRRWYDKLKQPAPHTEKEIAEAAAEQRALQRKPERVRRAFKALQLVRIIVKFGVVANIPECERLATALSNMEFSAPAARKARVTFEQTKAFCEKAIALGRISMAQAQALQFELTLRQIDVIGEWEPAEPDAGGIVDRGRRWSGGALWSHIDEDGVFEKQTTKQLSSETTHVAMHDTMAYPYLRQMLDLTPPEKRIGPIVKDEASGLPYRHRHFCEIWREIADAVGIPKQVWNRDSRAGGVTEGSDAGADIEHLRHHATHSDVQTTGRYNRQTVEKTRKVAELRVAHRAVKNG